MTAVAAPARVGHPRIGIEGVRKTFTRRDGVEVRAIDDITLDVAPGEFVVLLGPSGCGKTTLLRAIAGLEPVQAGRIVLDGRTVEDPGGGVRVPPERRGLSMMFQSYALWPHLSVADNVAYPLTTRRVPRRERADRVGRALAAVGIGDLGEQFPGRLSGGQQQRVALARALVAGDGIVLFDEPLSNVDAKVRDQLRGEIRRLHAELGFTAVYVTHDQEEALTLATRLVVLREGRIAQSAPPAEVYLRPADTGVARFMGAGNELAGTVAADGVRTAVGPVVAREHALPADTRVLAFSRPEDWRFAPGAEVANRWRGRVETAVFLGPLSEYTVALEGGVVVRVRTLGTSGPEVGDAVGVGVPAEAVRLLEDPS
ncbi:ABC transporter ATP-binding protein [Pseudonocardia sp. NPDC049154]|uniref:ABC transporter ATP-binding protein n=1 Tax=Pseudonocardia sp. NPDC049154 TaxID=3155501 RepID=UPI0033FA0742